MIIMQPPTKHYKGGNVMYLWADQKIAPPNKGEGDLRDVAVKLSDYGFACQIPNEPINGDAHFSRAGFHAPITNAPIESVSFCNDPRVMRGRGTPVFLPPEMLVTKTPIATPAGDIYAVGCALYYVLTGKMNPLSIFLNDNSRKEKSLKEKPDHVLEQEYMDEHGYEIDVLSTVTILPT